MLFSKLSASILYAVLLPYTAHASPLPTRSEPLVSSYTPVANLTRLASLMPKSTLATPAGHLKYVVLGLGTQNYTCISGNDADAPGTTGAVAKLYDIGSRLSDDVAAEWKIPTISGIALSLSGHQKELEVILKSQGYNHIIGHHFFSGVGGTSAPTFALDQLSQTPYPVARVTKINGVDAPKNAFQGLEGEGAVQWLHLADTQNLSHGGIDTVYRLETAGGKAPKTCMGQEPSFEVPYAAQYWIFGPLPEVR